MAKLEYHLNYDPMDCEEINTMNMGYDTYKDIMNQNEDFNVELTNAIVKRYGLAGYVIDHSREVKTVYYKLKNTVELSSGMVVNRVALVAKGEINFSFYEGLDEEFVKIIKEYEEAYLRGNAKDETISALGVTNCEYNENDEESFVYTMSRAHHTNRVYKAVMELITDCNRYLTKLSTQFCAELKIEDMVEYQRICEKFNSIIYTINDYEWLKNELHYYASKLQVLHSEILFKYNRTFGEYLQHNSNSPGYQAYAVNTGVPKFDNGLRTLVYQSIYTKDDAYKRVQFLKLFVDTFNVRIAVTPDKKLMVYSFCGVDNLQVTFDKKIKAVMEAPLYKYNDEADKDKIDRFKKSIEEIYDMLTRE